MKEKYICPLCGKEYDTPEGMARCTLDCSEKKHKEEQRAKAEQLIDLFNNLAKRGKMW